MMRREPDYTLGCASRFAQHFNLGYTLGTGDVGEQLGPLAAAGVGSELPDEVNYAAGVEVVATPRLTLIGDVIGRSIRGVGRLVEISKTFEFQLPVPTQPTPSAAFREFDPRRGDLHTVLGVVGAKFNPVGDS